MSSFYGLDIARKGLTAAQKGIDVTGHNIANADTPGYSRQRLQIEAIEPAVLGSRFAPAVKGASGGGVAIVTVDQVRNAFLDRQYRQENSLASEGETRLEHLIYLESLFDELSDTGLSRAMAQFTDSLQELSRNPTNKEYRTHVLQNALKLSETFRHYHSQLTDKQAELNLAAETMAGQVNDLASTIADLNIQIARYELGGQKANDLRDKRNLMLDQLSGLVDFTYAENNQGQLQIQVDGQTLVDHDQVRLIGVVADLANPVTGQPDALNRVIWLDTQASVEPGGGSLQAVLDLRDGATPDRIGIPWLSDKLDQLAASLASSVNDVHAAGWTLPDSQSGTPSQTGQLFFAVPLAGDGSPLPVTAANLAVDPAIVADVNRIAASSQPVDSPARMGNNQTILGIIDLFNRKDLPDIGSYSGHLQSFIGSLAIDVSHTQKRLEGQNVLVSSIEMQRQSMSGVSVDEEMTSLIRLQHSYSAAARMITAIDQNLDTLINKTGLVGR